MLTLTEINIYPVKSLGGIRMKAAYAGERGLRYDRRWMITHDDYTFITQREIPTMSLLGTELTQKGIRIFLKNDPGNEIILPFAVAGKRIDTAVFDDKVQAIHYNSVADKWISDALKTPSRFIYMPDDASRKVPEEYSVNEEHVSFADGFPYLIIGESSLEDLNSRMKVALPMNRFRPNIVFKGGHAFAEDQWSKFKVGNVLFQAMKPCGRCAITTINQDTAEQGKEPLRTLATYRSVNNKVLFGMNVIALTHGEINVGDKLSVIGQ